MRARPRWNPDWQRSDYTDIEAPESNTDVPEVTVSERQDRVLYGPRGEELRRFADRPFRGYAGDER